MRSFGFILHMISEKKIFKHFYKKIDPFWRPDNQSNAPIWKKSHMKHRGLLNKHFCKKNPNISIETEKKLQIYTFPILILWEL